MKLRSSFQLTSNKASGIVLVLCNWSVGFAKALAFLSKFTRHSAYSDGCQIGTRLCVYKSPFSSQNCILIVFSSATYISIRSIVLLVYPFRIYWRIFIYSKLIFQWASNFLLDKCTLSLNMKTHRKSLDKVRYLTLPQPLYLSRFTRAWLLMQPAKQQRSLLTTSPGVICSKDGYRYPLYKSLSRYRESHVAE